MSEIDPGGVIPGDPPPDPDAPPTPPVEDDPILPGWESAVEAAQDAARQAPVIRDYPPTVDDGEGLSAGAGWNEYDPATGRLVQMWRWDGADWQRLDMSPQMIPAVDIGTGTFGDLDGGRIGANSISAEKVAGGSFVGKTFVGGEFKSAEDPAADGGVIFGGSVGISAYAPGGEQTFGVDSSTGEVSILGDLSTRSRYGYGVFLSPTSYRSLSSNPVSRERPGLALGRTDGTGRRGQIGGDGIASTGGTEIDEVSVMSLSVVESDGGLAGGRITIDEDGVDLGGHGPSAQFWSNAHVQVFGNSSYMRAGSLGDDTYESVIEVSEGVIELSATTVNLAPNGQTNLNGTTNINGMTYSPGIRDNTTSKTANVFIATGNGNLARSTSSRRYKTDITDWTPTREQVLALQPRSWTPIDGDTEGTADGRFVGFIAEEVHDLGLTELVSYMDDENGDPRPEALNYDRFAAAQQVVIRDHEKRIKALEDQLREMK